MQSLPNIFMYEVSYFSIITIINPFLRYSLTQIVNLSCDVIKIAFNCSFHNLNRST